MVIYGYVVEYTELGSENWKTETIDGINFCYKNFDRASKEMMGMKKKYDEKKYVFRVTPVYNSMFTKTTKNTNTFDEESQIY